jgi:hypothetical protein
MVSLVRRPRDLRVHPADDPRESRGRAQRKTVETDDLVVAAPGVVLVCGRCGKYKTTGEMVDQNADNRPNAGPDERLFQAPKISDALKKGAYVSVTTWGGREMAGLVCDREQSGLLLDVREPDADAEGYVFLPWSSVEQVKVREVAQRRVKFLQS